MRVSLDDLPYHTPATVTEIQWDALSEGDARKLRNLGFDEGVAIESLYGAPFGRDPLAVRIGRMQIALRLAQARLISVTPGGADGA
jgi:ferrous iron transport protein A